MIRFELVLPTHYLGNEVEQNILRKLLRSKRMPNTILFTGVGSVGKALLAYFFAKSLVCESRKVMERSSTEEGNVLHFCDECYPCRSIETGNQPDFVGIRPKTTELTISQVRQYYDSFRNAYLHPKTLEYRIFILDECHIMKEELANSMLKLLEEPPEKTLFILVTDKPYLVLPTILSRSFKLTFRPEPVERVEEFLRSNDLGLRVSESAVKLASYFSQGRVGLAKTLLLEPGFLSELASFLAKMLKPFKDDTRVKNSFFMSFRDEIFALADTLLALLLRIELCEDLPESFYLVPWRRAVSAEIIQQEEREKITSARKSELAQESLRFLFECIKVSFLKIESEGRFPLASSNQELFSVTNSMLDVNLPVKQVVEYFLGGITS